MATIDQIETRIGRRLRRKVGVGTTLRTEIIDELVAAQVKLEEGPTLPWFLLVRKVKTVAGVHSEVTLDTDFANFIRVWDGGRGLEVLDPSVTDVDEEPYKVVPFDDDLTVVLQKQSGSVAESITLPKIAFQEGDTIFVRQEQKIGRTYRLHAYWKDPTVPATGATTLWSTNFADLLMNMAGREMAWTLRDDAAEARFEKDLAIARSNFIRAVAARADAGQEHEMGKD